MIAWLLSAAVLLADPPSITPQKAAQIERDQQKAGAEISKKFGDKKPGELSSDERREMIRAQAEADREVLDKHGVDAKSWARYSQTQGRDGYAAQKAQVKELVEKEKAEAAKAQQPKEPKEITIQRGISDEQPAVLEEVEGGSPIVEMGLPSEARADDEFAKDLDSADRGDKPDKKAEPKRPVGSGKRR